MARLLTHTAALQALFVGGALQIVVANRQAHGVAAGISWTTLAITGHWHTHALLR